MEDSYKHCGGDIQYWKNRTKAIENRNRDLCREIARLKGFKPLTKKQIEDHNKTIAPQIVDKLS